MNTDKPKENAMELPRWFWLWTVIFVLVAQIAVRVIAPEFAQKYMLGEKGIIENLTVVVLIPAIGYAIYILLNAKRLPSAKLTLWYGLIGLAAIYFAGEEASWGQHWIGWNTPDGFKALNDQGETNFHNMSSWLDQKPRLIVELGALLAGVLLPLYFKWKKISFAVGSWQSYFWPTWVCLPVCAMVGFVKMPDRILGSRNVPYPFNLSISETHELFVALAFLIYLMSVAIRLKRNIKG